MAVALAEGRSIGEAGFFGSAAAALSTTKMGAQAGLPNRLDLIRLLKRTAPPALAATLR
jgi:ribokinase